MAYGVALGQTPILNANGITYDNSSTSDVISGTNVQTAIDDIANKVKDSSGGLQWVKLGERQLKRTTAKSGETTINSFVNIDDCYALMVCFNGIVHNCTMGFNIKADEVSLSDNIDYTHIDAVDVTLNMLGVIGTKHINSEAKSVFTTENAGKPYKLSDKVVIYSSLSYTYDFTQYVYGLKLL